MTVRYHGREYEVVGVYVGRLSGGSEPELCYVLRQDTWPDPSVISPYLDGRRANRPETLRIGETE